MKKIYLFIFTFLCCLFVDNVSANTIDSINMKIDIDKSGTANITEEWHVKGTDGTEWYKVMNGLGNSELSNFKVSMDGTELKSKPWNVNESLEQKKGYYGINYTGAGLELCFGKYDYNSHVFTLNYTLTNYVINTEDSQVLYWNLIDKLSNVDFHNFSVEVSSYYEFPDTLDVWGYGYKGYAYVKDGKIYMSNEDPMNSNYAVLLVKFPLQTFNNDNRKEGYNTFADVYEAAEAGSFKYDYNETSIGELIGNILTVIIGFFAPVAVVILSIVFAYRRGYGYINNKKINEKDVNMFRDIPCNKDIYYANALINLNDWNFKSTNIFGAIILKWIRSDKIRFKNEKKGIFNKETSSIDLTLNPSFDNDLERQLFDIMHEASQDGILEAKEFEKWSRKHYSKFFNVFDRITEQEISKLKTEGHVYKRTNKNECKKKNVMDDVIYEDSVKLLGLKKFLKEFSLMNEKEAIEVRLWDEYLMFAYLFNMANRVAKQFQNLYPEVVREMESSHFSYSDLTFIQYMSTTSVNAASSARAAATSYSSGGGGFSSGGGGGGSFGGGGGGSR